MSISFNTIGEVVATFKQNNAVNVGDLIAINDDGTVDKATANQEVIGVCASKNGEYIGVQIKGGVEVACDETLATGYKAIKATSDNKVSVSASGAVHLVCKVNAGVATIIL